MSDRDIVSSSVKAKTRIHSDGENFTQQSGKDQADINLIVESAKRGADLSHLSVKSPMYGDFAGMPDFYSAMLMISKANSLFMRLDPFVRERFGNDPGRLLKFLDDPQNREEGIKLGLIQDPSKPGTAIPPVVSPVDPSVPPVDFKSFTARLEALEADVRTDRGDTVQ